MWLTNVPAPYRIPLWDALACRRQLQVLCLAEREPGHLWAEASHPAYVSVLHAPRVMGRSTPLYLPSGSLIRFFLQHRRATWVIDGWESPAYLLVIVLLWALRRPPVLAYRATPESAARASCLLAWIRRSVFRGAGAVLAGGSLTAALVEGWGVRPERVQLAPNLVDSRALAETARRLDVPQPAGRGHTFLFVGQLIDRKGVDLLIDAFDAMADDSDRLVVVGDGPRREALESRAPHSRTARLITFSGPLSGEQLVGAYLNAHTLVLPSREEIWGLVVNEALSTGCGAVVSAAAGCAEYFANHAGVAIVAPTIEGLAQGMRARREAGTGRIDDPVVVRQGIQPAVDAALAAIRSARR